LEQNGEKNDEQSINGEDSSKEWFCPVYGLEVVNVRRFKWIIGGREDRIKRGF